MKMSDVLAVEHDSNYYRSPSWRDSGYSEEAAILSEAISKSLDALSRIMRRDLEALAEEDAS